MTQYADSCPPDWWADSPAPTEPVGVAAHQLSQASPPSPPPVHGARLSLDGSPRADALQHVIVRDSPPHRQLQAGSRDSGSPRSPPPAFLEPLAVLLQRCMHLNTAACPEEAACSPAQRCSPFHGRRVPPISLGAYLERISKHAKCSPVCFVMAVTYLERLAEDDAALAPAPLNIHRLLLTGVLLAAKLMDDRYYNNAYYAKVGGVGLEELNALELHMMQALDFRLRVGALPVTQTLARINACGDTTTTQLAARFVRLLSPAALLRCGTVDSDTAGSVSDADPPLQQREQDRGQRRQQPHRSSLDRHSAASVVPFTTDCIAAY